MYADAANALIDLIYIPVCLLCRKKINSGKKAVICSRCLSAIPENIPPFCQNCGRTITNGAVCGACQGAKFSFERAWASCPYSGNIKELIHLFKYKNRPFLGCALSKIMIDFIEKYHLPVNHCDCLIPIPLSRRKLREREFNQSELLAESLYRHFGKILIKDNLSRVRDNHSQTELPVSQRVQNVQGVFKIKSPDTIKGKTILLIDDVFTTGATTSEASSVLKEAGAQAVFVLALAN